MLLKNKKRSKPIIYIVPQIEKEWREGNGQGLNGAEIEMSEGVEFQKGNSIFRRDL